MKHIKIFDTTLRDGEQTPRVNLNSEEKLRIARQLESLGVDIIEAGFAVSSPGDFEAVKLIADNIKTSTVTSLARAMKKDIEAAAEALKGAVKPRIHTFIATSPIHREFKLKKQFRGEENADGIQLWCGNTKTEYPNPPDTGDLPFCCQLSDWDLCAGMGKISRNPGCKEAF